MPEERFGMTFESHDVHLAMIVVALTIAGGDFACDTCHRTA